MVDLRRSFFAAAVGFAVVVVLSQLSIYDRPTELFRLVRTCEPGTSHQLLLD